MGFALVFVTACAGTQSPTRVDKSLFDYDSDLPVDIAEDRLIGDASTVVRHLTFPSPRGGDVSAMIFSPERGRTRAGVILQHGLPGGGLLAGVEDRIDAFALVVGDGGLVAHFTDNEGKPLGPLGELPEDEADEWLAVMSPVEPALFIGDASAPILLLNGREDQLVTEEDASSFHRAAGPEHEVILYNAGHGLNDEAWHKQVRWLAEHLQLDADLVEACLDTRR